MTQTFSDGGIDQFGELRPAAKWPRVVGITSVVLGSLGLLCNGCFGFFGVIGTPMLERWLRTLPAPQGVPPEKSPATAADALALQRPWMTVQGLLAFVGVAVSIWLLIAGISMLKRRRSSVGMHVGWAWVRLLLTVVGLAVGLLMAFVTAPGLSKLQGETQSWLIFKGVAGALVGTVIVGAYPVIVLYVLSRPWAKEEVARWGGGDGIDLPPDGTP